MPEVNARADIRAKKMVINLEEALGGERFSVPRKCWYDVLVRSGAVEKHIEVKGIDRGDRFFAINEIAGVRNLLFDEKYHIYFCDVNNRKILITL